MTTLKLKTLYKKRNLTKKSYQYFKDNLTLYLTPDEISRLSCRNDLNKYIQTKGINMRYHSIIKTLQEYNRHYHQNKEMISKLAEKIRKYFHSYDFKYSEDSNFLIRGRYSNVTSYLQLKTKVQCRDYDILNLNLLGKRFPFFQVSKMEISPSNQKILLSVDFIGSQVFHLFIKDLYSNEIREIKIPKQTMKPTHSVFSGTSDTNSTQEAIWLDDNRIAYVSIDRYYNDSGVYMYDLKTERHKLLYKGKHGYFITLNTVDSGLYYLLIISNYHSDEVYIMDAETYKVNPRPILRRKSSVRYPYINHIDGQWIIQKQDRNIDTIRITKDLKEYIILYKNTNPYEQILDLNYGNDTFVFTLSTLKNVKLYALKCSQLKLLEQSKTRKLITKNESVLD